MLGSFLGFIDRPADDRLSLDHGASGWNRPNAKKLMVDKLGAWLWRTTGFGLSAP
jgi:hypothetical protein